MKRDYVQISWDSTLESDCRSLLALAHAEDLAGQQDWTTVSLVPDNALGEADVVARDNGIIAGLRIIPLAVDNFDLTLQVTLHAEDGDRIGAGDRVANIKGHARELLTFERVMLNFIGHLSGIATKTDRFCQLTTGFRASIYDTRKTTPGWRRLEKYAVSCGGGRNHRTGLYDGLLIKDNHLALAHDLTCGEESNDYSLAKAVAQARGFIEQHFSQNDVKSGPRMIEIEVDTLDQLAVVLTEQPDIVLLDNMTPGQLRKAVSMRDERAPVVELEASGRVSESTVAEIARTGVDRISVGGLTHSAPTFDVGLDWK